MVRKSRKQFMVFSIHSSKKRTKNHYPDHLYFWKYILRIVIFVRFGKNWGHHIICFPDCLTFRTLNILFLSLLGLLATYSGAGSIQDLREERKVTKSILRELKEGLWIKRGTRYVSVDFTLYNANINYFCVIT